MLVTVVLFVGTIAGVVVFAAEEEEEHGAEAVATGTETGTGETQNDAGAADGRRNRG